MPSPRPLPAGVPDGPHIVADAFDREAATYDDAYRSTRDRALDLWLLSYLAEYGVRNCTDSIILDIGCGTGWLLDRLDLQPRRYVGVDVSFAMLERAKKKHGEYNFAVGDAHSPVPEAMRARFDVALMLWGVPSYFHAPRVAFQRAAAALARGGILIAVGYAPGRSRFGAAGMSTAAWRALPASSFADLVSIDGAFRVIEAFGLDVFAGSLWLPASVRARLLEVERNTLGRTREKRAAYSVVAAVKVG